MLCSIVLPIAEIMGCTLLNRMQNIALQHDPVFVFVHARERCFHRQAGRAAAFAIVELRVDRVQAPDDHAAVIATTDKQPGVEK